MARIAFKLPDIGEGIAEAEIVAWHVAVGEMVEEDQPLADMMTDKATVEMSAPVSGRVAEIAGMVGDRIAIGSVLAVFEGEEGEGEEEAVVAVAPSEAGQVAAPKAEPEPERGEDNRSVRAASSAVQTRPSRTRDEAVLDKFEPNLAGAHEPDSAVDNKPRVLASPAVRARAKDLGVDLAAVKPATGDRVRHADLDAFLRYADAPARQRDAPARQREAPDAVETIKLVGLRRRIAENMAEAKRRIPHFAYVEEIDVTALEALRATLNETRGARPKLTLLPFLIRAITRALPDFPMINARFDDEAGIVSRHAAVHLGLATQTDAGLTVPVIRDAGGRDLWNLATEIARLADAARRGKATAQEMSGSTITLTSLGPLGGIASTPVINRPEVAIVGVNRIVERPAVVEGRIEVRKLMNLSSSFDHRVIDGWDAASFIQAVRQSIEMPALLFVG